MRMSAFTSGLALLALSGCVDAPPAAVPLPLAASHEMPAPVPVSEPPPLAPPLAIQVTDVLDSRSTRVASHPNCTDYRVTGTLQGAVRTVTGRSCRLPGGGLTVTERNPMTGQSTTTTYPAPPSGIDAPSAAYGSSEPGVAGDDPAYGSYGYDGGPYPFAFYDAFFWDYPFFAFGCCGYGYGGGWHGGHGYGGGWHGGYGYGGGWHGGGGGYGFHGGGYQGGGSGGGFQGGGGGGHR